MRRLGEARAPPPHLARPRAVDGARPRWSTARRRRAAAGAPARRRGAAAAEQRRALPRARASASSWRRARRSTCSSSAAGPAGLGAAVYGASEGLDTLVIESTVLGGQAGHLAPDRELPRLPGRDQRHRADQPRGHPGAQVRRPHGDARTGRVALEPGDGPARRAARGRSRGRRARRRARDRRRVPPPAGRRASRSYEGVSVFYAAGPPEAQLCGAQRVGVIGGGNSAAQAAIWLARGGALVTLLHRRADLARDDVALPDRRARALRRGGARPQRDRRAARRPTASSRRSPHRRRRELPFSFLFLLPRRRARAPTGSATRSPATRRASSSRAPRPGPTACSRPACRASTRPATCAPARSSAAPPRSARARRRSASSTSTWPTRRRPRAPERGSSALSQLPHLQVGLGGAEQRPHGSRPIGAALHLRDAGRRTGRSGRRHRS